MSKSTPMNHVKVSIYRLHFVALCCSTCIKGNLGSARARVCECVFFTSRCASLAPSFGPLQSQPVSSTNRRTNQSRSSHPALGRSRVSPSNLSLVSVTLPPANQPAISFSLPPLVRSPLFASSLFTAPSFPLFLLLLLLPVCTSAPRRLSLPLPPACVVRPSLPLSLPAPCSLSSHSQLKSGGFSFPPAEIGRTYVGASSLRDFTCSRVH